MPWTTYLPPPERTALYALVSKLFRLRIINVQMTEPPTNVVLHLSGLSSLRSWTDVAFPLVPNLHAFTTRGGRFASLRRFGIQTQSLDSTADIMKSMNCWLEYLKIESRSPRKESIISLGNMLSSFTGHHHSSPCLFHLILDLLNRFRAARPSPLSGFLRPLTLLPALRILVITLDIILELQDEWLKEVSMAWPHLQSLSLYEVHHRPDRGPNMTLAGLIPLIKNCPQLSRLTLSIIVEPFHPSLLGYASNLLITSLRLPHSPITHPFKVGRCLTAMFPMLHDLDGKCNPGDEKPWDDLRKWLRTSAP